MEIDFDENIGVNQLELMFNDDKSCLEFLSELKWSNGFVCRKCGNENFSDGKIPHSRRCTRCKNEESATSNTLFHNIKFPISKAFYIVYEVCQNKNNLSSFDFAKKLSIRQLTSWNFKHKIENKLTRMSNLSKSGVLSMKEILVGNNDSLFM